MSEGIMANYCFQVTQILLVNRKPANYNYFPTCLTQPPPPEQGLAG